MCYNNSMKYHINKVTSKRGAITYYLATAVRNGSRVSKKNILSLGTHDSLIAQGHSDVKAYLQSILDEYNKDINDTITLKLNPNKQVLKNTTSSVEAGSLFIKRIFDDIKLNDTFDEIAQNYQFKYPLSDIILFHIANRIIHPDSKFGMYNHAKEHSLLNVDFSKDSIYRAMDVIYENKNKILKVCYDNMPYKVNRNRNILYYHCTNTYFESEVEDGLRARGKGKRNEKEPLVSVGLVMDGSGIPLSYTVFEGNKNEQKTLIPLENEIINEFRSSKFVMITDAGLSSKENRCFNGIANRKYITTLPVRKMSDEKLKLYIFNSEKEWISTNKELKSPKAINDEYNSLTNKLAEAVNNNDADLIKKLNSQIQNILNLIIYRRFPVKIDKKPVKYLEHRKDKDNPDKCFIEEDYLISYSLKYALRQKKQRNKLIEKAKEILKKPSKLKAHGVNDPKQYIIKTEFKKDDGEIITDSVYELSNELIASQEALDGYYCVSTNLTEDDNQTIIDAMKYRWFIEDSFRLMKQEFDFHPVNHSKDDRITTHFTLCFLSLLIYRYIQKMCHESNLDSLKNITDEKLISSLREYNLTIVKKDYYIPSFNLSPEILDLENLFNIFLSREIMTPAIINKEIKKSLRNTK